MSIQGPKVLAWWFNTGKKQSIDIRREQFFLQGIASWWLANCANGFVKWHMADFLKQIEHIADIDISTLTTQDLQKKQRQISDAIEKLEEANEMCKIVFQKKNVSDGNVKIPKKRLNDLGVFLLKARSLVDIAHGMIHQVLCILKN